MAAADDTRAVVAASGNIDQLPLSTSPLRLPEVIAVSLPDASSQTSGPGTQSIDVPFGQTGRMAMDGATAAYSLDANIASAAARGGVVTVVGRGPGTTHVVVTQGARLEYVRVRVGEPPVTRLPGFTAAGQPELSRGSASASYASDLGLLQTGVRLLRRDGEKSVELAVSTGTAIADRALPPVSLPLATLTIKNGRREVTLMDSVIDNSPLTVARSNVRGLHWQEGPFRFHGGYNFFGAFEHLLLPAERHAVAGVSYRHRLTGTTTVTPNVFYYRSPSGGSGDGVTATTVIETEPFAGSRALAEVALGNGTGGVALDLQVSRPNLQAWTTLRVAPDALPSLRNDQPAGRQLDAGVVRQSDRWGLDARTILQRFEVGRTAQSSHVARLDITRSFSRALQVRTGSYFSVFDAGVSSRAKVTSVGIPAGVVVSAGPIGAGLDFQWSRDNGQRKAGQLVRASVNGRRGRLYVSGSAERQTQALTLAAVYAEQPTLQRELDRLGIAASTPEQLAEALRTNASLANLGYAGLVRVDRTPTRDRATGRVSWTAPGRLRPRIELGTTINRDAWATRTGRSSLHSATASARLTAGTEAALSWSVVCPDRPLASGKCQPAVVISLQQQVGRMARLLSGRSSGDVEGVVFRDDQGLGRYVSSAHGLAGYQVVLDGARRTLTGADGSYRFRGVNPGAHRVEVVLPAGAAVYFTTPSPVDVHSGDAAHFGIAAVRSRLRVQTRSDVDHPLVGVVIHASDGHKTHTATTDADGIAPFDGLDAGSYEVHVDAGSLPIGYYVDDPAPRRASVLPTTPTDLLSFSVRAARSIAGRVRRFDSDAGTYVPAPDTVVELQPTAARSITDAEGRYVFRGLPAGTYTVVAAAPGRTASAQVIVPIGPAVITSIDLQLAAQRRFDSVPSAMPQR